MNVHAICGICLENDVTAETQGFLSTCCHIFHHDCIFRWSEITNSCPACKVEFHEIVQKNANGEIIHQQAISPAVQKYEEDTTLAIPEGCCVCGLGTTYLPIVIKISKLNASINLRQ